MDWILFFVLYLYFYKFVLHKPLLPNLTWSGLLFHSGQNIKCFLIAKAAHIFSSLQFAAYSGAVFSPKYTASVFLRQLYTAYACRFTFGHAGNGR